MSTTSHRLGSHPSTKLVAGLAVLALVALGVLGLVLPIIPGLLLLAVAAVIGALHFPAIDTRLRRFRVARKHLDAAERASALPLDARVRLAGWYCLKALADGAAFVAAIVTAMVTKLRAPAR